MSEFKEKKFIIDLKNKINSEYNVKMIFSFLNQRRKLNMIMYNKELRKLIEINIEDYKKLSGRYKIDGKNGNGREYKINTNNLIFEGEYINGKRNGHGKEYYLNGKTKFEGQYLNSKRWNGNVYDKNGIIGL